MAIKIFFDGTAIQNDYIVSLSESAQPYNDSFKLGATICRQFVVGVDNAGFATTPSVVTIYDSDITGTLYPYATLYVDSVEEIDGFYTEFTLVDAMVKLNRKFVPTTSPATVKQLVTDICNQNGITDGTGNNLYLGSMSVDWASGACSQRDFISYVAEVNGAFAYIDKNNSLIIEGIKTQQTYIQSYNTNMCSNFDLGDKHKYDRVYVELGTATKYYPATSTYETLYLNPDNILFTDSGSYTIDATIQHIYGEINGYEFYNINIENAPVKSLNAEYEDVTLMPNYPGRLVSITDNGSTYLTISSIDWTYNCGWIGGVHTNLNTQTQDETKVDNTSQLNKKIEIIVDRQTGVISQRVTEVEADVAEHTSLIEQNAQAITAEVTRATGAEGTLSTNITATAGKVAVVVDNNNQVKASVVVDAINDSGSTVKIDADKIQMTGTTTFLTKASADTYYDSIGAANAVKNGLATANYTTINGGNITTGTISASRVDLSGYLTVGQGDSRYDSSGAATTAANAVKNGLSTSGYTTINGGNITTGSLSANRINGGTIDASNVTINNLNADKITSGTLSASRIDCQGVVDAASITANKLLVRNSSSQTLLDAGYSSSTAVKIGGFSVTNDGMEKSWSNGSVGIYNGSSGASSSVITVGYGSDWPFWVHADGSMQASKATITGSSHINEGVYLGSTNSYKLDSYNKSVCGSSYPNGIKMGAVGGGTYVGVGNNSSAGVVELYGDTTATKKILPISSGSYDLGSSSYRWRSGYITNAWNVSSRTIKDNIKSVDESYNELFDNLKPRTYTLKELESEGTHIGYVADEVKDAINNAKLNVNDFAAYKPVDENEEGSIEYLSYNDFIALNTWQIQKLKAENAELKSELADIKARLSKLEEV